MNLNFKLEFHPHVSIDIQEQVDYYRKETQSSELGKRFIKAIKIEVERLKKYALHYEVKYDAIRCLPIPNFPFRIHYRVNENDGVVKIEAIINTSKNPSNWMKK